MSSTSKTGAGDPCGGRARGFTLIELLVVVGILAVLTAILMPSLARSREAARATKCMINLRSFGIALESYRRENKDLLPAVLPFQVPTPDLTGSNLNNDPGLLEVLQRYMDAPTPQRLNPDDPESPFQARDPYFCPSDRGPDVGAKSGVSYEYWAGTLMIVREIFGDRNSTFSVTKLYESSGDFPVMGDAQGWHKQSGNTGQNALYFGDWHVDALKFPAGERIGQLETVIRSTNPGNPNNPAP